MSNKLLWSQWRQLCQNPDFFCQCIGIDTSHCPMVHELRVRQEDFDKVSFQMLCKQLTHRGRMAHICVSKVTIISSDNGLSPGRRQAIIWTNAGVLLIGPVGTNVSEMLIEIFTFSFKKMRLKISSAKWLPCCLGLNMLSINEIFKKTVG